MTTVVSSNGHDIGVTEPVVPRIHDQILDCVFYWTYVLVFSAGTVKVLVYPQVACSGVFRGDPRSRWLP